MITLILFHQVNKRFSNSALNLELRSAVALSNIHLFFYVINHQNEPFKTDFEKKACDMKSTIKIIQEYDKQVAKEGKVNKAQFASKHGLTKSIK